MKYVFPSEPLPIEFKVGEFRFERIVLEDHCGLYTIGLKVFGKHNHFEHFKYLSDRELILGLPLYVKRLEELDAESELLLAERERQRKIDQERHEREYKQWQIEEAARREDEKALKEALDKRRKNIEERRSRYRQPSPERNLEIFAKRLSGMTLVQIGDEFGLTSQSIRIICAREERRREYRRHCSMQVTRPIDMGGPRDHDLIWTPQMQAQEFGLL